MTKLTLDQILILALAGAIVLIMGLAAALYIVRLRAERTVLELNLSAARLTVESLEYERAADKAALINRDLTVRQLAEARDQLDAQLREIYATDCEAAAWADTDMPGDVYDRLCRAVP